MPVESARTSLSSNPIQTFKKSFQLSVLMSLCLLEVNYIFTFKKRYFYTVIFGFKPNDHEVFCKWIDSVSMQVRRAIVVFLKNRCTCIYIWVYVYVHMKQVKVSLNNALAVCKAVWNFLFNFLKCWFQPIKLISQGAMTCVWKPPS